MKKINLRGISEILSEKELKNVMGGSNVCSGDTVCNGHSGCAQGGTIGVCKKNIWGNCICQ